MDLPAPMPPVSPTASTEQTLPGALRTARRCRCTGRDVTAARSLVHPESAGIPAILRDRPTHERILPRHSARRGRRVPDQPRPAPPAPATRSTWPSGWAWPWSATSRPSSPSREDRRRHQAVPLPRPGPADPERHRHVGPGRGGGNGHPPEHRLPLPHGPVLLAGGRAPHPGLDRPAVLDGLAVLRRRDRGLGPRPAARPVPVGPVGRGPGLHAHALRPRLHHPDLRHRHAVGRPGVDAGPDRPGRAQGRVAVSGAASPW